MAENRRGKDRRYFFTLGQMVLLATAFMLTCVIVFFLGILIGKGIEARKVVKPEEPLVKVPIKPSVQGSAGTAGATSKEELTFYETLTKSPHPEPGLDGNGYGKDEKESAKPLKREAPKDSKADSNRVVAAPPRKPPEKRIEQAAPPDPPASAQSAETAERKENGKVWTVQVNAYPDERSARQLVDRLKNKGYNALMTETHNKGKLWYRVRVGSYDSREEADKALEELKSKEKFANAFATSRQ